MVGVEQVRNLNLEELCGRVFLSVVAVTGAFDLLCTKYGISPEAARDELDTYEYATLRLDGQLFEIEKYGQEKKGYTLLLLSENPNVRETARFILSALDVPEASYCFIDQGYHDYPRAKRVDCAGDGVASQ